MILVEIKPNDTLVRASMQGAALEAWWDAGITGISSIQWSLPVDHGGYCELQYGSINFSPHIFDDMWPPPASFTITAKRTDHMAPDEATAETLFSGTCHLRNIKESEVVYDIYGDSFTQKKAVGSTWDDTLSNAITAAATELGLSADTTAARNPSPVIEHTLTSERLLIDVIDDFCQFYSHLFYIREGTLYLVDLKTDNGSREITEFEFFPSSYELSVPTAEVTNDDHTVFSDYPYGNSLTQSAYHGTGANIIAAFQDILDTLNSPRVQLKISFNDKLPIPGERVSWTDTAVGVTAWIRARSITYDYNNDAVTIDGEGGVS